MLRLSSLLELINKLTIGNLLFLGVIVRLLLIGYAHIHDRIFRVKYTDIDYMIIVDGAREVWQGESPFKRTTFRYTPLLAILMLPSVLVTNTMGKFIFCLCDLGAAYYCYEVLLTFSKETSAKRMVSIYILFNPIVLNVSTRGNSDMLVAFMSILVLAKFTQLKYYQASAVLGFAIHFKIYPIIYSFPLVLCLWENTKANGIIQRLKHFIPLVIVCGFISVVFFSIPTILCYIWLGQQYLDNAFLYHFYREDHRHNFSPYWLLMYLNMAHGDDAGLNYAPGLVAFLPQTLVLLVVSYKLRRNAAHTCCIDTMLFIAFNKVCTVQYFVWFIPFLPFIFCEPRDERQIKSRPGVWKMTSLGLMWVSTIPLWMTTAVQLEFYGKSDFGKLWFMSCLFFLTMVSATAWLARLAYRIQLEEAGGKLKAA